jgi:alkaline phosphatase D
MKITRRKLLGTAGVATVAVALPLPGCGDDAAPPMPDGGMPPVDAGMDAPVTPDGGPPDGGPAPATGPFRHGVASGDPLPDSVILWTRVTPEDPGMAGEVMVTWEIAPDATFATITAMGMITTNAARDFTVKHDATGLMPATTYYYRFSALGETSAIGRTRTAPMGSTARLRFAVASCSSYAWGYFHAYRAIAARADLDAVIHLGDYIYEYGTGGYGNVRPVDPPHETVSLEDYRRRYAHYRLDEELKEAHRQHPFITTWDDHESANNSWRDGAENHMPASEGTWMERKAAAAQAYAEWMPYREQKPEGKLWRTLQYGDLAEIVVMDTRIWGRDQEVSSMSDPRFMDASRTLLGADQETFVTNALGASAARWKLLAQQIVVAPFPIFFNSDAWDGYPGARDRLFDAIRPVDDVVVLTGDIHMSFAGDLPEDLATYNPMTGAGSIAVEMIVPGITSPGLGETLAPAFDEMIMDSAPHAKAWNVWKRGYMVLDITPERVQGAWQLFERVDRITADETTEFVVSTATGSRRTTVDTMAAPPPASPPPLAP